MLFVVVSSKTCLSPERTTEEEEGGGEEWFLFPLSYVKLSSLVCSLLRRHSLGSSRNLLPPRASAEAKGTFRALCLLESQSRLQIAWISRDSYFRANRRRLIVWCQANNKLDRLAQRFQNKTLFYSIQFAFSDLRTLHSFHGEIYYSPSRAFE